MKRYTKLKTIIPHYSGSDYVIENRMVLRSDGEWVKYEDVKGIEKIGFGRTKCALCHADLAQGNHYNSCELIKGKLGCCCSTRTSGCNCEEEAYAIGLRPDGTGRIRKESWVCPTHGYKRR